MIIQISDDFDIQKIADSGQCFRVREMEHGLYRFITGQHVLFMRKVSAKRYEVSCTRPVWNRIWKLYFDLNRNYAAIRESLKGQHPFVDEAMEFGKGIRILRQDPWEMLITFILSQRKSIPAISSCVELVSKKYGKEIEAGIYSFPTPQALNNVSEEALRACQFGYRAPYVVDAVQKVIEGLDMSVLSSFSDASLMETLLSVHGVGIKVAGCVALFGYGRTGSAPVDVWIQRAIDEEFEGINIFDHFGELAGIVQQYVFYYKRHL